jgi:membrane-associated phospholipid phosphatase
MLAPLFPLGMPGGYITMAYAIAHWLHRRRDRGGPAIVTAGWAGWLSQRIAKELFIRERPRRRGVPRRIESFPSGHTTGTTAFALTAAYVLRRDGLITAPAAALLGAGGPLLMGAYRVIDDEHWMSDVLAGWLLGAAVGLTCCATLADSEGRAVHRFTESASSRQGPRRRVRREAATSAG